MKQFLLARVFLDNRSMRKNSAINIRNSTLPPIVGFAVGNFTHRITNTTQICCTCAVTPTILEAILFRMERRLQKATCRLFPTRYSTPPNRKCISQNTFLPLVQSAFTKNCPKKLPGFLLSVPITCRFECSGFPRVILRECWRSFSVEVSLRKVGPAPPIPCFCVSTVRKTWNEHWRKTGLFWMGVSLACVVAHRKKWGGRKGKSRGSWWVSWWIRGRKRAGKWSEETIC